MAAAPIHLDHLEQGLDRKDLTRLQARFLALNAERLHRARLALGERGEPALTLLPLLLHLNHPALPGYVSGDTPAGIAGYQPDSATLTSARRLARGFRHRRGGERRHAIEALYLMGSTGSLAQAGGSDLDIWVCLDPALGSDDLPPLISKLDRIAAWGRELGVAMHFYPLTAEQVRQGELGSLSREGSGSTQHYLLLDEFYRTALHLAGRVPLWWFVPASREGDYQAVTDWLLGRRFLAADAVIDFGPVPSIPPAEFVSAATWQLFKSLSDPHKAVLKLLLLTSYAGEQPRGRPLCLDFKAAIHGGEDDADALDPYGLIYQRLEHYLLTRQQYERLEWIRRCFYRKAGRALSGAGAAWQNAHLRQLTASWGWGPTQWQRLDGGGDWAISDALAEHQALVAELTQNFRQLQSLTQVLAVTERGDPQELQRLGRTLQAAFARRAGKLEWLLPGITGDRGQPQLWLQPQGLPQKTGGERGNEGWSLRLAPEAPVLRSASSPVALLVWAQANGLLQPRTRIQLPGISASAGQRLQQWLADWLPTARPQPDPDAVTQAPSNQRALLLINVTDDPQARRQPPLTRISAHDDALSYSGLRENLIGAIDQVLTTSWGEVLCQHYAGADALADWLQEYLRAHPPGRGLALPQLEVRALSEHHGERIRQRLLGLWQAIVACFYSGTHRPDSRFLVAVAEHFYLVRGGEQAQVQRLADRDAVRAALARPQSRPSPLVIERPALLDPALGALAPLAGHGDAWLVLHREQLHWLCPHGELISQPAAALPEAQLLRPHWQFLNNVLSRLDHAGGRFFAAWDGRGAILPQPLPWRSAQVPWLELQAVVGAAADGSLSTTYYLGAEEFAESSLGQALATAVVDAVLAARPSRGAYPLYLSDLDLSGAALAISGDGALSLGHYLDWKQRLEGDLNAALSWRTE